MVGGRGVLVGAGVLVGTAQVQSLSLVHVALRHAPPLHTSEPSQSLSTEQVLLHDASGVGDGVGEGVGEGLGVGDGLGVGVGQVQSA